MDRKIPPTTKTPPTTAVVTVHLLAGILKMRKAAKTRAA